MKPDHKQPLIPREAELLAPSGSLSCMKAAISGGADAVYFGGTAFNARKSAANFTKEDIEEGIRLCRLHGVRTHLTVNTSIKEKEFPQLIDFLEETVPLGVDALIVQDPGVMLYLREHFPDVEIHASTQMAVSSLDGAKLMESMGISRVVLARELTLSEIEKIRRGTKLSLEVFVHGALCYGVSGRCLLSSFHGGRSGNRGACAQPCRLWYECQSMEEGLNARGKNSQRSAGERTAEGYFLNLKDQAAYPHLKQLLDLGVDSFKIEGRMKSEAYVYAVSRFYRSLITEYEKTGNILPPSKDQLDELKQLFNRGSFTDGYFLHKDHMIEPLTPKNQGLRIGRVKSAQGSRIQIESVYPMHAGDELEIDPAQKTGAYPAAVRLSASMLRSDRLAVFNFKDPHFRIAENDSVRRVVDPVLQNELSRKSAEPVPVPIRISGVLREGMPSQWKAVVRDHVMQIEGPAPERAEKTSLSKETIQAQMSRMGNSPFVLEEIHLEMDDNLFLPVSSLNQIRRQLTEGMEEILTSRPKISAAGGCPKKFADADPGRVSSDSLSAFEGCGGMQIVFENREQLEQALTHEKLKSILNQVPRRTDDLSVSLVLSIDGFAGEDPALLLDRLAGYISPARIHLRLPLWGKEESKDFCIRQIHRWMQAGVSVFEASFPGQIRWIASQGGKVFLGPEMNLWNRESIRFYRSLDEADCITGFCLSRELSLRELKDVGNLGSVYAVCYGRVPYMLTAQCPYKEAFGCRKKHGPYILQDRKGEKIKGISNCDLCYNRLYSEKPVLMPGEIGISKRIEFTVETAPEIREALDYFLGVSADKPPAASLGHFRKEVM